MKDTIWLAGIIALRFLGLFLVMPLISIYAYEQPQSTPYLIGLAVGGYALIQMLFQYPFGRLSDKIGRKPVIFAGLILFAIGSVICAYSSDIYMLILGRFIQGSGAISSTVMAIVSDITTEENRSKAMAIVGASIGMSFIVSLLAGPLIGGHLGIENLFLLTAGLSIFAIIILFTKIPTPKKIHKPIDADSKYLLEILKHKQLMQLNFANFFNAMIMTSSFFFIPLVTTKFYGWEKSDLWKIFLPALIAGVLSMGVAVMIGEKKGHIKNVFLFAITTLIVGYLISYFTTSIEMFILSVMMIFVGINSVEPLMQSSASKYAKSHNRGAALGVFNSFQFFGVFLGGIGAGIISKYVETKDLSIFIALIAIFWLILIFFMQNPPRVKSIISECINIEELKSINGIVEIYQVEDTQKYIIRYNNNIIDQTSILAIIRN